MTHDKHAAHDHAAGVTNRTRLLVAIGIVAVFLVVEVIGAALSGSLALLADAGHMLSDVFGLTVALVALLIAARPATDRQTFGYQRAEVFGALVNGVILAGTGFRSASNSHEEIAEIYNREVVTLKLINPSFYHLDTAIAVLDDTNIAYLESAFDEESLVKLRALFPDAILATEEDAAVLGLNSYSDGYNIVIASRAKDFERQLRERGYNPIGVDLSELLLGGGGVKCCTLELRR